ncbi:MAG: hypothetical protein ACRESY_10160 [Steroidobacteraceae bacterium]
MAAAAELAIRDSEFRGTVGVARGDITPPEGMFARSWGSSKHDIATGVHKPLLATAIAFADSGRRAPLVLLAMDLSWWTSNQDESDLRTPILAASGLQPQQLMFHPSHTHSAPRTDLEFSNRPGGHLIGQYRSNIVATCSALVAQARERLSPATLTWRAGHCALAFNRDLLSPLDGRILCGVNPGGKPDDTLLLGRVVGEEGELRATLVNYACHPISLGGGNTQISPDYVGAMRETIEAQAGGQCLFLHGCSGDQAPRRSFESDPRYADQNGRELGYSALSVLASMFAPQHALQFAGAEESGTPLAIWQERSIAAASAIAARRVTLRLEIADLPSRAELQRAIGEAKEAYMVERLTRRLLQRESIGDGPDAEFTFLVWRLGDSFIVGTPAEMHSAFQLELRRRFPGHSVAILNIVNGYASYLPPRADYAVGAYPTRVALFKVGSMEKVLEAATAAMRELM